jgi:hypothetical protein
MANLEQEFLADYQLVPSFCPIFYYFNASLASQTAIFKVQIRDLEGFVQNI